MGNRFEEDHIKATSVYPTLSQEEQEQAEGHVNVSSQRVYGSVCEERGIWERAISELDALTKETLKNTDEHEKIDSDIGELLMQWISSTDMSTAFLNCPNGSKRILMRFPVETPWICRRGLQSLGKESSLQTERVS
eukprot:2504668-Amphidinium_carterae.1